MIGEKAPEMIAAEHGVKLAEFVGEAALASARRTAKMPRLPVAEG